MPAGPAGAVPPPVRILHTSDLHLGEAPDHERALAAVVDLALARRVDLVLLVGDVFDHGRVGAGVTGALAGELGRLTAPVVVLPGNHDPVMAGSVYDRVELPPHVRVLRRPEGEAVAFPDLGVEVWGRPHVSWDDSRPLADVPPRGELPWQVALAHGHLVRGPADRQRSYLLTSDEIAGCGRDYLALGHWDVQADVSAGGVTAWYSGSPTRTRSCALVTLAAGEGGPTTTVEPVRLDDGREAHGS